MNIVDVLMTLGLMLTFIKRLLSDERVPKAEALLEEMKSNPPKEWFDLPKSDQTLLDQLTRMIRSQQKINNVIELIMTLLHEATPENEIPPYEHSFHYARRQTVEKLRHCLRDRMREHEWRSPERQKMEELDVIYVAQLTFYNRRINDIETSQIERQMRCVARWIQNEYAALFQPWNISLTKGRDSRQITEKIIYLEKYYDDLKKELDGRHFEAMKSTQASFKRSISIEERLLQEDIERQQSRTRRLRDRASLREYTLMERKRRQMRKEIQLDNGLNTDSMAFYKAGQEEA